MRQNLRIEGFFRFPMFGVNEKGGRGKFLKVNCMAIWKCRPMGQPAVVIGFFCFVLEHVLQGEKDTNVSFHFFRSKNH